MVKSKSGHEVKVGTEGYLVSADGKMTKVIVTGIFGYRRTEGGTHISIEGMDEDYKFYSDYIAENLCTDIVWAQAEVIDILSGKIRQIKYLLGNK